MNTNNHFFQTLFKLYRDINISEKFEYLYKLDKHMSYYLADNENKIIYSFSNLDNYIIELDIKSAFPTICKCIFGKDNEFVKSIFNLQDKTARNIHIATRLKDTGYLEQLNLTCKMVILSIVFSLLEKDETITILEFKKDGILLLVNSRIRSILTDLINEKQFNYFSSNNQNILEFILINNEFEIHNKEFYSYLRSNKTSKYITYDYEMKTKGMFKYSPPFLNNVSKQILLDNYSDNMLSSIKEYYNNKYLQILLRHGLIELLSKYYICDNQKVILRNNKYSKLNISIFNDIDPTVYLQMFIFPSIIASKNRKVNQIS